jgi:hypothetical protein
LEKKSLKNEITTKTASKTIVYAVVATILYYITMVENYSFPLSFEDRVVDVALRQFFEPILVYISLRFIKELMDLFFIGKYIPSLRTALSYLSFLVPIWMLSRPYTSLYVLTTISYNLILITCINLAFNLTKTYAIEKNNSAISIAANFFSIIFIGYIFSHAAREIGLNLISNNIIDFPPSLISGLSNLSLTSSILAAFLTLTVFFAKTENPYIIYLVEKINVNPVENFLRIFILFSYVIYLRPIVDSIFAENREYLPYFEWGIIFLLSYILFRNLRHYVSTSISRTDPMGQWSKHLQVIETRSDYRIDQLTEYIEEFINYGDKDILLVYLINLLSINHKGLLRTADALYDLIYYEPKNLELITFQWNRERTRQEEIKKRKEILSNLLPLIEELNVRQDTQKIQPEPIVGENI